MSDRLPISPIDCPHHARLFVMSHRSAPQSERYTVTLCRDCGRFLVVGSKSGIHFDIRFELCTQELVEAAGRYCKFLDQEEN